MPFKPKDPNNPYSPDVWVPDDEGRARFFERMYEQTKNKMYLILYQMIMGEGDYIPGYDDGEEPNSAK